MPQGLLTRLVQCLAQFVRSQLLHGLRLGAGQGPHHGSFMTLRTTQWQERQYLKLAMDLLEPLQSLLSMRQGAVNPRGQAVLLVGQGVELHAQLLPCLAVAAFAHHCEFGLDGCADTFNAVLKIHRFTQQAFKCGHIDDVGQTLWRGGLKLHLPTRVAPDLHALHRRGVCGVGPAPQVGQQGLAAGIQGKSAYIMGLGGRTHQSHAQAQTGQQQRQAAAHHATAADAHIKVGSHGIHCRSCLPVEFRLSRTTPAGAIPRIVMSLKCGIVGLPNVGKSTLFNALTKAGIAAENYPFCTIEPNTGVVEVPDPRLQQLAEIITPERIVPAIVEFVDIAGLVAGASTGEGLGNKFLAHIRETDAIVNVVRCFEDDNVIHVANKVDPIADIEVIQTELCLADLAAVEKAIHRVSKIARSGDKEAAKQLAILEKCQTALNDTKPVRTIDFSKEEHAELKQFFFITAKPAMFVANVSEDGFENNPFLDRLKAFAQAQNAPVVAICAKIEAELSEMDDADRLEFLQELGQSEPGLNRLIRSAYTLLGLQTYFTAGVKEVRAWTIRVGDTGPQAAGVIHTDFEKGYIRAQTIAFDDFIQFKGEQGAKDAGKMRAEGKEYVVKDGDVMNFLFSS